MQSHLRKLAIRRAAIESLESRQLLSAGNLDSSFGKGGITEAGFTSTSFAHDLAVQSDGKIVEAGSVGDSSDVALVRYNANGTLDTSFGPTQSGKVLFTYDTGDGGGYAAAIAIQADGKIVVAATRDGLAKFDVYRFNSNGSIDKSFGSSGRVNVDVGTLRQGFPSAIAVQKDGKIVIAGSTESDFGSDDFFVARLNTNGSTDTSFGPLVGTSKSLRAGKITVDFGGVDFANAMAIDYNDTASTNPDYGKIVVVGGDYDDLGENATTALMRLNTNGTLDSSFAGDGKRTDTLSGDKYAPAHSVTIVGDGNVFIAGGYSTDRAKNIAQGFLLRGYTPSGNINTTFGTNGVVKTTFNGGETEAFSIINGFSQRLIVGGTAGEELALAAYNYDGTLDPAFGKGGKTITALGQLANNIDAIAAGPNRTIIAEGGFVTSDNGNDFETERYFDVGPTVSVTSLDPTAGPTTTKVIGHKGAFPITEQVPNNASLIVSRDQKLPFATRVYFTLGGTANVPNASDTKAGKDSYTLNGMTVETSPTTSKVAYVDIPANQTFVTVTLSPENIPTTSKTATFTINSNALYDTAPPTAQTITILGTGSPPPPPPSTITDEADSYVQDGSDAADNFGTSAKLEVKEGSSGVNRITYLKFNLASISSANSVKLNLFGELSSSDATNVLTQLFSVSDTTWTENLITFNNMPTVGSSVLASNTIVNTTPTMYTFDVTAYVKAQLALGNKTVSFALKNPSNSSPFVVFNSKEAGSNAPTLTVS
jgi:uncharacterized delta-60 repeat protein